MTITVGSDAFQFALPRGERPTAPPTRNCRTCFNSRSRVGSDRLNAVLAELGEVSIRAPAWGATAQAHHPGYGRGGFNSRSRVGSDKDDPADFFVRAVSIRAPAWGATELVGAPHPGADVSIRAPAWGATMPSRMRRRLSSFQFALPRGERPTDSGSRRAEGIVSIRAPAWGATRPAWRSSPNRRFQFALPRGERPR